MNRIIYTTTGERTLKGLPASPANQFLWAIGDALEAIAGDPVRIAVSGAYDGAVYRLLADVFAGRRVLLHIDGEKQAAVSRGAAVLAGLDFEVLPLAGCPTPDAWIIDCAIYGEDPVVPTQAAIAAGAGVICLHDSKTASVLGLTYFKRARDAAGLLMANRGYSTGSVSVVETIPALKRGMLTAVLKSSRPTKPAVAVTKPAAAPAAKPVVPPPAAPFIPPPDPVRVILPLSEDAAPVAPAGYVALASLIGVPDSAETLIEMSLSKPGEPVEPLIVLPPWQPLPPQGDLGEPGIPEEDAGESAPESPAMEIVAEDTDGDGESDQVVIRPKRNRSQRTKKNNGPKS
jgi:hypothetical protein